MGGIKEAEKACREANPNSTIFATVKTHLAIGLCLFMIAEAMVPCMEISELSKIPALLNHFDQHRKQDNSISLVEFIELHYNNEDHHEMDHHTHDNLPFADHHHHNCKLFQLAYTVPNSTALAHTSFTSVAKNFNYHHSDSRTSLSTIWQPPRATALPS